MPVVGLTWIIGTLLPEREGMLCTQTRLLAAALLSFCGTADAQHVSLWAGGGLGSFLSGGSGVGDPNAHRIAGVSVSLAGDRLELRALKGTLERIGRHTSELQSQSNLVCRLLLEKKKKYTSINK